MRTGEDLRSRTKKFAIAVVALCRSLPNTPDARIIGNQLLRSSTSVGANYRAVCRARSDADFLSKIGIVLEEADESAFWLEMLADTNIVRQERTQALLAEANELVAIFTASRITASRHRH